MIDPRDADRARAVMGLPLGASPDQLRTRHRELVKQWHPDRFANDPQGQAEATVKMRAINAAYALLSDLAAQPAHYRPEPHATTTASATAPGARLTQEQIDRMVASIGTNSPVDVFLDSMPYGRLGRRRRDSLALKMPFVLGYLTFIGAAGLMQGSGRNPRWLGWIAAFATGVCVYSLARRYDTWWSRFDPDPNEPYWTGQRIAIALAAILVLGLVLLATGRIPAR